MNDILDIEVILQRKQYPIIYNIGSWLLIILLLFIYISKTYKYKTYYIAKGTMKDGYVQVLTRIEDMPYIIDNHRLKIDSVFYEYTVFKISEELYVDESFQNYKYVYLKVKNLSEINNYVYEIKLEKENKKIIEYLKEYL